MFTKISQILTMENIGFQEYFTNFYKQQTKDKSYLNPFEVFNIIKHYQVFPVRITIKLKK